MDILDYNYNFTLSKEVHGPLLAVAVGVELVFAFIVNLFVLIFTLCHPKTLKEPSIIFLTNFVLVNLLMVVVVMPSIIVTAATGEWVFGRTPEEKNGTCQLVGFVFVYTGFLTLLTLGVISVDRFLFIVEPFIHMRLMKARVAVVIVICIWISSCLLNIPPYFGLGKYVFLSAIGSCGPIWPGQRHYLIYFCTLSSVIICIILLTTVWTFCFTGRLIKNISKQRSTSEEEDNHIYRRRIKKLVGVFGMLLTGTLLTFLPGILVAMIEAVVGNRLPTPVFTAVVVVFLLNNAINPIIQSYFRRDIYEFFVHCYKMSLRIMDVTFEKSTINTSQNISHMTA